MFKRIFLLVLIFSIALVKPVFTKDYVDTVKTIKVAISTNNQQSLKYKEITVSATDNWEVYDKSENRLLYRFKPDFPLKIVLKNGFFDFYYNDDAIADMFTGPIYIRTTPKGRLKVVDLKRNGKQAEYRGVFEITKVNGSIEYFNLVNVLSLQEYLYGVVPNEMPSHFGLEALKAQSIAARNYALRPIQNTNNNYDVCDTVSSQVYYGSNTETSIANKAVDETENIVATYDGNIILALYSSTAGGYTENYENAFNKSGTKIFPANPLPYLKGVPDIENLPSLETEEAARAFYTTTPNTFDNNSPYFRWEKTWEKSELEEILNNYISKNKNNGFIKSTLNSDNPLGELQDIKITKRGVSGKVVSIVIMGDKNAYEIKKELVIRKLFQKNGISLPSANFILDFNYDENNKLQTIKATGGGFGHGVGMSQFGAGFLSKEGKSYEEILKHYYTGINLSTIPETLTNIADKNYIVRTFYIKEPYANLVIEKLTPEDDFYIKINDTKLKLNSYNPPKQKTVYKLDDFLKKGRNTVIYYYKENGLKQKDIKVYIELTEKNNKSGEKAE